MKQKILEIIGQVLCGVCEAEQTAFREKRLIDEAMFRGAKVKLVDLVEAIEATDLLQDTTGYTADQVKEAWAHVQSHFDEPCEHGDQELLDEVIQTITKGE